MPAAPGPNSISSNALAALGSRERDFVNALNTPGGGAGGPLGALSRSENAIVNLLNPSPTTPAPTTPAPANPPAPAAANASPAAVAPAQPTQLSQLAGFAGQNMTPAEQSLMQAQLTSSRGALPGGPSFATTIPSGGRFYQVPLSQFPSYTSPEEANRRYKQLSDWLNGAVAR